jgi:hypothetical protein
VKTPAEEQEQEQESAAAIGGPRRGALVKRSGGWSLR